jgi:hypothetical protein
MVILVAISLFIFILKVLILILTAAVCQIAPTIVVQKVAQDHRSPFSLLDLDTSTVKPLQPLARLEDRRSVDRALDIHGVGERPSKSNIASAPIQLCL